jgi:hypothetical protein
VQAIFDTLGGLGQAFGGKKTSLAEKPDRIAAFAEALASVTDSMLALGWKLDDLFNVLILPDADREVLMNALVTRTARTAGGGARQAAVSKSQGSS